MRGSQIASRIAVVLLPALSLLTSVAFVPSVRAAQLAEVRTADFVLQTDMEPERAQDAARKIEAFYAALPALLEPILGYRPTLPPFIVRIYETQEEYRKFAAVNAPELVNNGGYYDGASRMIVTYWLNNSMQLFFHEVAHGVLGEVFSDHLFRRYERAAWPVWFDEGVAEYLSSFTHDAGGAGLKFGADNRGKVAYLVNALETGTFVDLSKLLAARPEQFSGPDMNLYYAQSWALVRLLLSEPATAGKLPGFAGAISSGRDGREAFRDSFGGDVEGMDRRLKGQVWRLGYVQPGWRDLFDGRQIDEWTVHEGGDWRVEGGVLAASGSGGYRYLIRSDLPQSEFDLDLAVKLDAGTVGVILGNNFHAEYPYYYMLDISNNMLTLRRSYSESRIERLAYAACPLPLGRWAQLRVSVSGGSLRISLDGVERIVVPESKAYYSLYGLYLHNGSAGFREMKLRKFVADSGQGARPAAASQPPAPGTLNHPEGTR